MDTSLSGITLPEKAQESDTESSLTRSLNASGRVSVPVTDDVDDDAGHVAKLVKSGRNESSATSGGDQVPLLGVVQPAKTGVLASCIGCMGSLTVEPWLFLFSTSLYMTLTALRNLVLDKVCFFEFGYNDTMCNSVTNATIENEIQIQASNIDLYGSLVDTIPSIISSMFLGAFSDRRGRKLAMVIPLTGYVLSTFIYMCFAFYMEQVPAIFVPLAVLPRSMCGGIIAAIVSALNYVSDCSTPEKRTIRLALVEASFLIGQPVGQLVTGQLYPYSPVLVFAIGLAFGLGALLLVITTIRNDFIEKPVVADAAVDVGTANPSLCRDLFSVASMRDTFYAVFKRRENNGRFHVLSLLFIIIIVFTPSIGHSSIMFLYTRLQFGWTITMFTYFSASSAVVSSVGLGITAAVVVHFFKVPDKYLAPIGILGMIVNAVLLSFSSTPLFIYLSCIPLPISGLCLLSVRAQLSKFVPQDEQGKVFAVAGSCDSLIPLIASVLYTRVYNSTESFFPQACFVMSSGIYILALLLSMILLWDSRRSNYAALTEEPPLVEPQTEIVIAGM